MITLALVLACAPAPQEPVFVEVLRERETVLAGEAFVLRLLVGVDRDFLRERLLQPFRRELDLPVQIAVPWWEGMEALVALDEPTPLPAGVTTLRLAVNADEAPARACGERQVGERIYLLVEVERAFLAPRPGEMLLPAPLVRYASTSRFDVDFLGSRIPADRQEVEAAGEAVALRILPWPDEGRPADFGGAVGVFTVSASAAPLELEVGGTLRLVVRVARAGMGSDFPAPDLHALPGFHLAGLLEERDDDELRLLAELQPLDAAVHEVPAIAVSFLDPGPPARYRTAASAPIQLRVRGATAADPNRGAGLGERERRGFRGRAWTVLGLSAIVLGWMMRAWIRRSVKPRVAVAAPARASALADPAAALAAVLAARLGCTPAAVIDTDLEARLLRAGLTPDLADRAARTMENLTAARYGGPPAEGAAEEVPSLMTALEAVRPRP